MEQIGAAVLINGAVVVLLWGLAWRNHNQRVDMIQSSLSRMVERGYCELQHREIKDDIREIKLNQEKTLAAIEEIKMEKARENGYKRGKRSAKKKSVQ